MTSSQVFDYVLGALALLGIPTILSVVRYYMPCRQLGRLDRRLAIAEQYFNYLIASGRLTDYYAIAGFYDQLTQCVIYGTPCCESRTKSAFTSSHFARSLRCRALEIRFSLAETYYFVDECGHFIRGTPWLIIQCIREEQKLAREIEAAARPSGQRLSSL